MGDFNIKMYLALLFSIFFVLINFVSKQEKEKLLKDLFIDLSTAIIVELVVSVYFNTSLQ